MNTTLNGKKLLIGVTGGIAAYKIADLIRLLRHAGAQVQVVMTDHAKQFITPLTLQTLSGRAVYSDLFDTAFESDIGHIQLARWADTILVAPASANVIARLANGMADDLLTTLCLATHAPIIVAPAMNKHMWQHVAVMANVHTLRERGIVFIGPTIGEQACSDVGMGRMAEPQELVDALSASFAQPLFAGKKVLITAGPTHEYIDPIRYITTASTGHMGYAIAAAFAQSGADVCLVSGPSALDCPRNVHKIDVISAVDMHQAALHCLPADIVVCAAAVADYRVESPSSSKLKRHAENYSLNLIKNPDVLAAIKQASPQAFIIGFAAETNHHVQHAQEKLRHKNVDMLVLNSIADGQGFGAMPNSVTLFTRAGEIVEWPVLPKSLIAKQLVTLIAKQLATLTPSLIA